MDKAQEDQTTQEEPFFEELDKDRREPGSHSCCTVWTLGLLLAGILSISLFILFR